MSAYAMEQDLDIAKAQENPLKTNYYSKHISLPIENDSNFGDTQNNRTQNIFYLKPVVPFQITSSYDLIIRTIIPLYEHTPVSSANNSYVNGWGDLNPTFFISPIHYKTLVWGFGPTLSIPTSTNNHYIGTGRWSVGPELAMFVLPEQWVFGILTSNIWSVAGDLKRSAVDQFSFQYFVSYNFPSGMFFTMDPTITADWKKPGNQQWLVPIGVGAGKLFRWQQQSMNIDMHVNYNVIRPARIGPDWQLQLSVEFLYPRWTSNV